MYWPDAKIIIKALLIHFCQTAVVLKNSSISLLMSFCFVSVIKKNILLFLENDFFLYESFSSTYLFLLMSYRRIKVINFKRSYKLLFNYCCRILITHVLSQRIFNVLHLKHSTNLSCFTIISNTLKHILFYINLNQYILTWRIFHKNIISFTVYFYIFTCTIQEKNTSLVMI